MSDLPLTAHELEQTRNQAIKAYRQRLDSDQPQHHRYRNTEHPAAGFINAVLTWVKVFVAIVALLAAIASAIRTVQAVAEIYAASGSHPVAVIVAALCFTISTEAALFLLALAQENERLQAPVKRPPFTLKRLWNTLQVRIGLREPEPATGESGSLGLVITLAFSFAVAANAYLGLRPLLLQMGDSSLQQLFANLWTAPAQIQLTFLVDAVGLIFPPAMAFAAGQITARYALEIVEQSRHAQAAYERDLEAWRQQYQQPLDTEAGQALLEQFVEDKRRAKATRQSRASEVAATTNPFPVTNTPD